ncbi:mitochondrial carrier domain-containing protein [Pelagophyceae sp. CCMP2097]|nr:mitochondrial carrier domain-containing protein [Pelagophyceae sp. CCMP2097]
MHPLDTVKTKLMAGQDDVKFDTSLYQGLLGNIFKEAPSSALYLGVYEVVKTFLLATPQLGPYPILVYLIGGAAGEFFGSIIRAPAEAVKSMTQSGMCEDTGAAVRIVLEDVPTQQRIQRAWSSSLLRDVPMGAIQIAIFEGLKVAILNSPDVEFDVNTLQAEAALGGFGGFIAALVTTPMDVVTTRIITSEGGEGIRAMIQEILEEGGPIGLMRGAGSRALYWAPAIGIFLSCYCIIRQYAATSLFQV